MEQIYLLGFLVSAVLNIIHFALKVHYELGGKLSTYLIIPFIVTTLLLGLFSWVGVIILIISIYLLIKRYDL
jgi:hypothetical protein